MPTQDANPTDAFPPPIPQTDPPMAFDKVNNPDGWKPVDPSVLEALPPNLVEDFELGGRLFSQYGRTWLAGRLLGVADVERILEAIGDGEVGLHLSFFGKYPGLGEWLRWEGLGQIEHLSFNTGFLKSKGLGLLLSTGRLAQVKTLVLSVCDLGLKGLRQLNADDSMPALRELYLVANPDYDKTKWNDKAVAALLADTKKKPMGATLKGLEVLGLQFWELAGCMDKLEASPLVQGLTRLWLSDEYYADYRNQSNVKALPAALRAKTVVGWEATPLDS